MNPHSEIEHQLSNNNTMGGAATGESPKPFTFLQAFGEEGVGVCDAEGHCS